MIPKWTNNSNSLHLWSVAHLQSEEPEASPYLEDRWDDNSTLASTPSIQRGISPLTTILRNGTEPSHIIIAVERNVSRFEQLFQKLARAIRHFFSRRAGAGPRGTASCGISQTSSSAQPSLGINGVMV